MRIQMNDRRSGKGEGDKHIIPSLTATITISISHHVHPILTKELPATPCPAHATTHAHVALQCDKEMSIS